MKRQVVLFRGRSTDGIHADAVKAGIRRQGDDLKIVTFEGDRFAEPGDITPKDLSWAEYDETVIVANGGVTAPLVLVLGGIYRSSVEEDLLSNPHMVECPDPKRVWKWCVLNLQPDAAPQILGGDQIQFEPLAA